MKKTDYKESKFNPSLGGAFSNDKFGEGSVLLRITEENLDTLMKNVRVGSSILFRFNKVTSKGNKHYFADILPPWEPEEREVSGKPASELD